MLPALHAALETGDDDAVAEAVTLYMKVLRTLQDDLLELASLASASDGDEKK